MDLNPGPGDPVYKDEVALSPINPVREKSLQATEVAPVGAAFSNGVNQTKMERIWTKHKKINTTLKPKIVVGMSGGVDSSMALVLLKKQGWRPVGVSLKYTVWQNEKNLLRENLCCSTLSFKIAKDISKKLKVPYYVFEVAKDFKKEVIEYFIRELKNGHTPNPCLICNRWLKFKKLFEWAKKHNIKYVATGHYAQIRKNPLLGKYELLMSRDREKDQTYTLSLLPQKWLKYIVFPLGKYTKKEIYQMAKKEGFDFFLKRSESQDFCFVSRKCLNCFLEKELGRNPGIIKNTQGDILGKHQGLHFYTLGQRKGINLSGGPYFVVDKNPKNNVLVVSKDRGELYRNEATLSPYHFISIDSPKAKIQLQLKTRYRQPLAKATLFPLSKNKLKLVFNQPQRAITPGQFAVFYQKNVCLGGGRIIEVSGLNRSLLEYVRSLAQKLTHLYGSYAKGNFRKESDIDVCIVSPKITEDWDKNEKYLWHKRREIDSRLEPIAYGPEEFKKSWVPLVSEIKNNGIRIV